MPLCLLAVSPLAARGWLAGPRGLVADLGRSPWRGTERLVSSPLNLGEVRRAASCRLSARLPAVAFSAVAQLAHRPV